MLFLLHVAIAIFIESFTRNYIQDLFIFSKSLKGLVITCLGKFDNLAKIESSAF